MMNSRKSMAASAPTYIAGGTSGARNAVAVGPGQEDLEGMTYFEMERARLIQEISSGFEDLFGSANVLNRKLEEVFGVGKEFQTVAGLWGQFDNLIHQQKPDDQTPNNNLNAQASTSNNNNNDQTPGPGLRQSVGVPGTGGKHFAMGEER